MGSLIVFLIVIAVILSRSVSAKLTQAGEVDVPSIPDENEQFHELVEKLRERVVMLDQNSSDNEISESAEQNIFDFEAQQAMGAETQQSKEIEAPQAIETVVPPVSSVQAVENVSDAVVKQPEKPRKSKNKEELRKMVIYSEIFRAKYNE